MIHFERFIDEEIHSGIRYDSHHGGEIAFVKCPIAFFLLYMPEYVYKVFESTILLTIIRMTLLNIHTHKK